MNAATPLRRTLVFLSSLMLAPAALTGCDCGGPDPVAGTRLAFVAQPQGAQAGVAFTPAVQVAITDDDGNVITTSSAQVTLRLEGNPGGAALGGTLTQTAVEGVATFPDLSITRAAAGYTLNAASTGLSDAISSQFTISPGPPAGLAFVQAPGDAAAGVAIAPAVSVSLVDSFGNQTAAAAGVTVAIGSGPAGAALGGASTVTSSAGVATFPDLTLDLEGSYTLIVTSGSLPALTSPPFNVRPGAPASLAFSQQPGNAPAGTPIAPAVQVTLLDARGNVARGATDAVTLGIASNPGGAALSGTVTRNAVNGVAVFTDLSLDKAGTGYTLRATSGALPQATSGAFNVTAGAAAALAFTVQPSSGAIGAAISPPVQVTVLDAYGNRTASTAPVTVALGNNPSGATLSGALTQAAVAGVASFGDLSLDRIGTGYTLTASSGALASATSAAFDVSSGPAARLSFTVQPSNTTAATAISPAVQVSILDAGGNLVTSSSATVTIALGNNPGGGALSGVTVVAASGGVATFSALAVDRAGNGYTLTAASAGLTGATSNAFNVAAGPPAQLAFSVQPSSATAGAVIAPPVQVSILDAGGNLTSSTGAVTVAIGNNPGGGSLGGTTTMSAVAGVATFPNLTIDRSGTGYTLTAASTGVTGATSNAFDVAPGPASVLAFVQQPTSAVAGAAITPAVTVAIQDAFGNRTSSTATVTLAIGTNPGGGALSGTASQAAVAGLATFSNLSINRTGAGYTLNATSPGLAGASSSAFDIATGPAAALVFQQQPSNETAGASISPAVTVAITDALGNVVTSSTATVTVAIGNNPGGGTLSGTASRAAVAGVATFDDLSINRSGTGYTLTAASAGVTSATSSAFNIATGPPAQLAFTVQPSNAQAGAAIAPPIQVTIQDAFGNRTNSTFPVTVAIGNNPGGGTLSGTTSQLAVAGVATFANLSINRTGTGYTLTATSNSLTGATSSAFDISAAAAAQLAFTVHPSDATAGAAITPAVRVSILDAFGNQTGSTATVTAAIGNNPAGGTLSGTANRAAVAGVATFDDLSINRTGNGYTLTAASAGLAGATSNTFSITPGAPAQLAFGQQPSTTAVGAPITPAVTTLVQDSLGNTVTASTAPVTMALANTPDGGTGTLSGTLTQGSAAGVATFDDLAISAEGSGYLLRATSPGLTSVTSNVFSVTSGAQPGLSYTDPPAGGRIRLVRNAASTPTTVVLDLVAAVPLSGFQVGFNLPLSTARVQANATLQTPGSALPAGSAPIAARAVIPATGPLANVLVSGQSQKAAGAGAVPTNSSVPAGAVFYQLRLDLRTGATPGVVFDGAALGPLFSGNMRDRSGTDVAVSADFRIGRLVVN